MSARRRLAALAAAIAFLGAGAQGAFADGITNTIDATIDSTVESMPLNIGGSNGSTNLVWFQNADGKSGCDLTGQTSFTASVKSSNPNVATVSPSSVTFTSCGQTNPLTVTPLALGTTHITLTQTNNTTGYTIDLAPAAFDVTVNPPANSAPVVKVKGVASGQSYPFGTVPTASCDVTDAEDGTPTVAPTISPITGPNAGSGIGSQTVTCSYTDRGGLTATASATYSIVQASSTTTVTCPSSATTYTGSALTPCTATVTGTGGLSTSLPVTYGANTSAGTATASASFAGTVTHAASSGSSSFTIAKASSSTVLTCPSSVAWTGSALTPCTARVTGAGGLDSAVTPTYSANTAVGTSSVSAAYGGDANHTPSSDSGTFSIVRATSVVAITCTAGQVYTGSALAPCSATVTSAGGFQQPVTVVYTDNVEAGSATATATFAGDGTHAPAGDSTSFTIAKAPSTVSVGCSPTSVTYTGNPQTPCTASATGAGITTPITVVPTYTGNTNAGTAVVTATWAGDANHTGNEATGSFSIQRAGSAVTLTCPTSQVYSGSALSPCSATATGVGIATPIVVAPSYTDNTVVGTATVSASWSGDANHTGSADATKFAITKATSTVTITCLPTSVTYSGSAQTPCSAQANGAGITTPIALTPQYTDNTNAGTAGVTAAWAGDANHDGNTASTGFSIDKAGSTVTVTCPTASLTYTGSPQEPCNAKATGVGGLDAAVSGVTYSNNVNVGTATAWATYDGDANHVGSSGDTTFAIGRYTPVVTVTCPPAATYDGTHHPCSATVKGVGHELDGATASLDYGSNGNVDAGDVSVIATYTAPASSNYSNGEGRGSFTIAQATPTVTLDCPVGATYNGAPRPCTASVHGVGTQLDAAPATITYSANGNVNAGEVTATAKFVGSGNYTDASGTSSYTIARYTPTVAVLCPPTATYTGSAHPCTATAKGVGTELDSAEIALDYGTHGNVNAGEVTATGTYAGAANYNAATGTATFTIDKAVSQAAVSCTSPVTYTGTGLEPCSARVTGVGGLDRELPVRYVDNVDAGTATAYATFDGDDNHAGNSGQAIFTIGKAASRVVVTCPTTAPVYTGSAITPCTAGVTGVGGLDEAITEITYTDNVNVGTAGAAASYAGDKNHTASAGGDSFTIAKAESTVAVSCPETLVYTGLPLTPCTAKVSGVGGLDQQIPSVTHTDNVNVGTATASANYSGDANHNASSGSTTFGITKAGSTVTVTCPASQVYTGSALTPCAATLTGPGLQATSLTVSYGHNITVGTATASAAWSGDANHVGNSDSRGFDITKATSAVVVACPTSKTYTGTAIAPCTATVSGAGMEAIALSVLYAGNVNVGTATASAAWAGDDNHTGSDNAASFAITKADSTVKVSCPTSAIYTGSPIRPCSAAVTGPGLDPTALLVAYSSNTNVGTASASAAWDGDANHFGNSDSQTFGITKAGSAVTVTCPPSKVYTGAGIEPCTASVSGAGLDATAVSVQYADNVNVGSAKASSSWPGDANHDSSTGVATFDITKAASTVAVSCPTSTVYTGSALMPCSALLSGPGLTASSLTVSYGHNTEVGTASASATWAGDPNHTGSDDSKTFEITKASSTVTVTCPASRTYNGFAIEPCTASLTGAGMTATAPPVQYSNNVNAGTASASAEWLGDANHTGSKDATTFTIAQAQPTVSLSCPTDAVFDGTAHPCTATVQGVGSELVGVTPVITYGSSNVNAGSVTATATFAGGGNYATASASKTYAIAQAPSTVTVTCTAGPFIYTGSALAPCSAKVSGVAMADVVLTPSYVNNVYPGTATASASWGGDGNHLASSGEKTFTIGAWSLKGFYQPVDMGNVLNTVKGGSTVPLKFEVFSGNTELTSTSAVKSFTSKTVSCSAMSTALTDDIEVTTTGGTTLRYDTTAGQFIQNWQTPKTVGTCYQVTMTTQDGSPLTAYFKTK